MTELLLLIWEFFKTGLFAIGGGLATLPFLQRMSATHPHWFTTEMLGNMVAISESTPGPIGVNMATYVGFTVGGVGGAVLATLSLVAPSVIIIMMVYGLLQKYKDHKNVKNVFSALRPAVTGLIAAAGFSVLRMAVMTGGGEGFFGQLSWKALILYGVILAAALYKKTAKLHPIVFIAIGAAVGLLVTL